MRSCNKCGEEKPLDDTHFYFREARNNFETTCKKCRNKRKTQTRDRAHEREVHRNWYRKNAYREKLRRRAAREAMTEEQREEARRISKEKHAIYRQRLIDEYLAEHDGLSPLCECGCGERVGFNSQGRPRRFAGQNHHYNVDEIRVKVSEEHARRADEENRIPIDVFRRAARKVKEDKGWTWKQLAEAGGWSENHVKAMMFDKRAKNVGRQLGEDFFNRIAGLPVPPSTYMQKKADRELKRIEHRERTLDQMYMKDAS